MSTTQPRPTLSETAPRAPSPAVAPSGGFNLLQQTRQVLELLGDVFRLPRENSFQARSAQRAQAVQERRQLVHKAGTALAERAEPKRRRLD